MFTLDELNQLKKVNLVRLAKYYKMEDFSRWWNKDKMVEAIYNYTNPKKEENLPPMSARVRRIYESSNKEK